jgi:ssRNA-specific RNase YbeY (16S rRNA maturation enzyme)
MIVNRQRRIALAIRPLSDFLNRAQRELGFPESSVTVRLISDSAMARLNRRFRGGNSSAAIVASAMEAQQAQREWQWRR